MPARRTTFDKLQRDRAKKARAAAKRERRQGGEGQAAQREAPAPVAIDTQGELSPARLLELIEEIHRRFEAKQIDFEEFEEKKAELMARLTVD